MGVKRLTSLETHALGGSAQTLWALALDVRPATVLSLTSYHIVWNTGIC